MKNPASKFKAFTLAEILLTLTIIGVVAAITIPTLVNSIQSDQFKIAWKKSYSDLSQVTGLILNDNGGNLSGIFSNANVMRNEYSKYLNFVKSCTASTTEGCFWSSGKYLNGNTYNIGNNPGVILNNGNLLSFIWLDSTCTTVSLGIARCGAIAIDVNGFKTPNTFGKDVFAVHVLKNGITPYGSQGDDFSTNSQYSCTATGEGVQCPALYLYQ